jgi:hypothetical protein
VGGKNQNCMSEGQNLHLVIPSVIAGALRPSQDGEPAPKKVLSSEAVVYNIHKLQSGVAASDNKL